MSVQKPFQLRSLEKWSKREQLCLASAKSSGEDWKEISRTMKIMCCNDKSLPDMFSQKSCAVQYEQLLECLDTPKRKRRANQNDDGTQTPADESQMDFLLRQLAEDRMQELKEEIRQNQEEYSKIYEEIKAIQENQLTDDQLFEMGRQLELQEEAERIEQMKFENQLRERESEQNRKQEMQTGTWRTTDTTSVDMDVEEIVASTTGCGKPSLVSNVDAQQQHLASQPSSLLSSLLKSPTTSTAPSFPTTTSTISASSTAPTITTLLTSGSIPNKNQPTIVLKSTIPPKEAAHLLTRPISGPPTDVLIVSGNNTQTLLSPSQSAPTLSMLLEKKNVTPAVDAQVIKGPASEIKEEMRRPHSTVLNSTDSNNEEIPMDIEEEAIVANSSNVGVISEPDCNEEEEQLLEVFKNIGNIDELDIDVAGVIDEEDDFLGGVVDEEPSDVVAASDLDNKIEGNIIEGVGVHDSKNEENSENGSNLPKIEATEDIKPNVEQNAKVETISSDDSNDNIPLSAVASLESKERSRHDEDTDDKDFLIENSEAENEAAAKTDSNGDEGTVSCDTVTETLQTENIEVEAQKSSAEIDKDLVTPPITDDDDESNGEKHVELCKEASPTNVEQKDAQNELKNEADARKEQISSSLEDITETAISTTATTVTTECETDEPPLVQETNSLVDTDEDSTMTDDTEKTTRKDDTNIMSEQQKTRKLVVAIECLHDHKNVSDDIGTTSAVPAKPPVLRKLRDRDRSESPMIDDEANISITGGDHSSNQRSLRRYSSTPVIDSIINSPASEMGDFDRETRSARKILFRIANALQLSKHAVVFQRIFNEEHALKRDAICLRFMDLQIIKRNIEIGAIRTVHELQRDVLLMCQNALLLSTRNPGNFKAVKDFMSECQSIREFVQNPNNNTVQKTEKDASPATPVQSKSSAVTNSGVKVRGSARKSQRII